ncbi:MAG: hypothetical protein NVS1B5_13880 [Gemmatimonadaceae bacterium]
MPPSLFAEIHPEAADKRFRVWTSKLNRTLYGTRWYKHDRGIRWAGALEMQRREVIHYHALLGGSGLADVPRFAYMDEWNELAGYSRIDPPRNKVPRKNANKVISRSSFTLLKCAQPP